MQQSELPVDEANRTEIRLAVCGGQQPRLSIGVPVAALAGLAPEDRRVTVECSAFGRLTLRLGRGGMYALIESGPHWFWTQMLAEKAPFACTRERRTPAILPATIDGDAIVAADLIPADFFRDGRRPTGVAPLEDLRARIAWINTQISARRASGAEVEPVIRDGEIRLRVVEEVIL